MALYNSGKIRFDKDFINQFPQDVRAFLRNQRYNLVEDYRSQYCTIEHWLYNHSLEDIEQDLYNFLLGYNHASPRNYEKVMVRSQIQCHKFIEVLRDIEQKMKQENNW